MKDSFGREISYLRISVTDRCNLRCTYCMPAGGVSPKQHEEILSFEEIHRIVTAATTIGIRRVRLTGGEPLVRRDIVDLVATLAHLPAVEEVALTTNGTLLAGLASDLAAAGLARVNVSLDSLQPDRFRLLTRGGELHKVLAGIDAATDAGLRPVKVNTVVVKGFNDDEVADLAGFTVGHEVNLRFIELMALGESRERGHEGYVSSSELMGRLGVDPASLEPVAVTGNGPARTYRLPGAKGTIGFISPVSDRFCDTCNRLRLTADGHLRPCLLSDREVDARGPLRAGAGATELAGLIAEAVALKPKEQEYPQDGPVSGTCGATAVAAAGEEMGSCNRGKFMSQIGG